ncbi:MAG: TetR/AcrR family transcriptional regulator [Acidimicrobiia bacterium]
MTAARAELLDRVMGEVATAGITDRSLREIATAVGTSHRMLLYHFGSRAELVAAIVDRVEADQRRVFRELATTTQDPRELVQALWRRLTAPDVLPFARLFFETVAFQARNPGADRLTAPWLDDAGPVTEQLGIAFDPADVRLGVAVMRGLMIDVLVTGRLDDATGALERFLAGWPLPRPATSRSRRSR